MSEIKHAYFEEITKEVKNFSSHPEKILKIEDFSKDDYIKAKIENLEKILRGKYMVTKKRRKRWCNS